MPQDARNEARESCGSSARTSKEVVLDSVPALLGLFTFDDQKCSRFQRAHKVKERGYKVMPLRLSFWRNHPNIEVKHARGKRQYGSCQAVAEREMARAVRRD